MLGIEPSTFVSKIDILTTTPIVHDIMQCILKISIHNNQRHLLTTSKSFKDLHMA